MSGHVHGKGLQEAFAQGAKLRQENAEELRKAVVRQVRMGLNDTQIVRVLRSAGFKLDKDKVREVREAVGLAANGRDDL